jgi:hypothetical protein
MGGWPFKLFPLALDLERAGGSSYACLIKAYGETFALRLSEWNSFHALRVFKFD